ncbi:MAG: DUF4402 domain-containing protein [Desulfobacterales bacterium]|nr:DUF4402 domain-containing protein [Desulfobacterales bacterium]MCP4163753.1 DUF4402 domain-containing protein [Deltaproteobacteria bacterium]
MNKRFYYILFCFLIYGDCYATDQTFSITITIRKPITILVTQEFDFGTHELTGASFNVTVEPEEKGSAIFKIEGSNSSVSYTVTEESIQLSNGKESIKVSDFKVTGGGTTGTGNIAEGELKNVGVGATAYIASNQADTTYFGNATFRVTYN